jgi:hypothetical protein
MKGKAGHLFTLAVVLCVPLVLAVGATAIKNRVLDSKQTLLSGLLGGTQGLAKASESDLSAAREEAARLKALADLREARARAEATRKRLGDFTPTVEAVVAGADQRLCALIGDELVYEGSRIQGYQIRKIDGGAVEFERDGKVWVQKIH